MKKLLKWSLLCYFCIIVFMLVGFGDANHKSMEKHRQRRFLRFRNITTCFVRLNFKANMVWWNQIFAQALGFRLNYNAPPDSFHPHHLYRRTVYNDLELLLDKNGLNGYHCVRRAICEMAMIHVPRGAYHKILKMIFRQSSDTNRWHSIPPEDCPMSINLCPFSLLDISLHTDV